MDRTILPYLSIDDLGNAIAGWFLDTLNVDINLIDFDPRYPVFQSPCCNVRTTLSNHSIKPDGEVNASIICKCGQYHIFGILDQWPSDFHKDVGSLTIQPNQ